jgi:hypothetical protein
MRLSSGVLVAIGLAVVIGACGDPPTAPGSGSGSGSGKSLRGIRISGPASLTPGATGQFTAAADYSDGSTEDVTATVAWRSSNGSVLAISLGTRGVATARNRGESVVTAISGLTTSPGFQVLVLEPGTFKMAGRVTESGGPLVRPATVEVIEGVGTGLKAQTSFNGSGSYALYGVAGNIRLRVSAPGYVSTTRETVVGNHDAVSDFELVSEVPPVDIRGKWTTTLSASAECSERLADDARVRVFDTTVLQAGTQLSLTMENPVSGTVIRPVAQMVDGRLKLDLWKFSYYGEPGHLLLERLDASRWLGIAGTVEATITGQEIRGLLPGEFVTYKDLTFRGAVETGACLSSSHGFTMRRQ